MTQITRVTIEPAHVRMALQSAIGCDLRFPSVELEEHVAKVLTNCKFWTLEEPCSKQSS